MKEEYCTLSPSKDDGVLFDVSNKNTIFLMMKTYRRADGLEHLCTFFAHYGMSNVDFLKEKKKLVKFLY